ncbi:MAG: hypothetical protein LN415_03375 [Candidatus Thermoplasmatota archaeon]|nr:hypothetical protein [Candidatus Thermoplasmatota archaeon]
MLVCLSILEMGTCLGFIPTEAGKKMLIALVDMLRAMCVQCLVLGGEPESSL